MKNLRKTVGLVLCILLAASMLVACSSGGSSSATSAGGSAEAVAEEETGATDTAYKIGVAFYDLNNPTWAEMGEHLVQYAKDEYGAEATLVGADSNAAKQVTQLENFVESGVDAIILGAVEVNSVEEITKKAMEQGIVVFAYGFHITNYDAELMVQNYDTGYECGKQAAEWIQANYDGVCEVGLINLPDSQDLIERENGIKDAMEELAPDSPIVATGKADTTAKGLAAVETMLQAHPDMKVVVAVGDGGAVGASTAFKAAGADPTKVATFGVDATQEALQGIKDGDPIKMSISLGGAPVQAEMMVDTTMKVLNGEDFTKDAVMPIIPVTQETVEEYAASIGWTLN
ncbi:MAG: sugar ABC transporter substrate-binding protein [Clostridiales Family XIII bacterium]|jgi:ribose transport system substrate-binding protein|nr:sugar ABC transporter substrate-binding protein [Clostridiales Family XIII bacterium]